MFNLYIIGVRKEMNMLGNIKQGLMVGSINGMIQSLSDILSRLTDSPVYIKEILSEISSKACHHRFKGLDPQTEVWLVYYS